MPNPPGRGLTASPPRKPKTREGLDIEGYSRAQSGRSERPSCHIPQIRPTTPSYRIPSHQGPFFLTRETATGL